MFNNISWSAYLAFIAISALTYYVFVFYTYYRHDLLRTLKGKQALANSVYVTGDVSMQTAVNHGHYKPKLEESIMQSFSDEVQAYLEEAGQRDIPKDILLQSLSVIAGKYPSLAQSAYKESINDFIISKTEINCAVSISEDEVRGIWGRS